MKERIVAAGAGALLFFLLIGGLWVGVGFLVPAGIPRQIVIVGLAFLFLVAYLFLLISKVGEILGGTDRLFFHSAIAVLEVGAMLLSFAAVYREIGIIDNSVEPARVVHKFWSSLYYSVVTFTTLGYGDFYPRGIGRALAGMQALTGYIVLGVLASVAANVLSPHHPAGQQGDPPDDDKEEG